MNNLESIRKNDLEIFEYIQKEMDRQEYTIELIASENATSQTIMEASGSCLTNKYAEGYPQKRYYGGCEHVDEIESIAIQRAKQLFGAEAANVQPHSGSQANMAVYLTELNPGDRILGMSLAEGGHLSHGTKVNFSGKVYESHSYGVDQETGLIDYEALSKQANELKPKLIIAGASAYPRTIEFKKIKEIADECGAKLLADIAHIAGLVAAGYHPTPVGYADYITTTTHKTLRGPRSGLILTKEENLKKINSAVFPGMQGGPLMHVIAAKAIAFKEAMSDEFKDYANQVILNAKAIAEGLKERQFDLVTDGTDNHLVLLNLTQQDIRGKDLEIALDKAGLTLNKNAVPGDKRSAFITSGVRIGSSTITTRGMRENEMKQIVNWIIEVTNNMENEKILQKIKKEVKELCLKYPLYKK